ncbi:type I polyketide synthase [Numidum massiliense]|uniref:type I polyketide synthase n=1 Tax=Numidum massiliense TaxID=1522315 RepID=UPI0006D58FFA|nr:type I polyketide synthase [Numidum massiliense]
MEQVKKYILSQLAMQKLSKEEAKALLLDLQSNPKEPLQGDVAIIGMASRFPKADDPEAFWELLRDGVNCIRDYPKARFNDFEHVLRNPHYSEFMLGQVIRQEDVPYVHTKAGYLEEIDKFDAQFFGIPPTEAIYMDPQQRMALEVAWEAMEDAGYGGDSLVGSRTGVYVGKEGTNYSFYRHHSAGHPMQLTGSWESLMVSRISYLYDFKAPCMVVDTACSSGLVSIHMAVQALLNGECDLAIAGGINLSSGGELKPQFQGKANLSDVESGDGLVRTFDAKANGTVWGEGVGLVMLKPLQKAIEDRDHIRAVIKGSAINNDGAASSITAPRAETQEAVIVDAWQKAGIPPETISYIEAHGTGTVLGDPIEVKGLSNSFRRFTSRRQFCAVGSLKTNMGHLVGASGVASLIKVIKSIEHKELAPNINFETPNPYINFMDSPLYVNDSLQPWDTGGVPRRAALSSFGFSRTNCHMVVEEPPVLEVSAAHQPRYCFTISAKNEDVLQQYVTRYTRFLAKGEWTLADLCYTSNIGRGHYEHRVVVIAETEVALRRALDALSEKSIHASQIPGTFAGHFHIVSEKKVQREEGERSKHELTILSEKAKATLQSYLDGGSTNVNLLEEVCRLYVQGATVDWQMLYRGERRRRVAAPIYPLQRTRYWADPKISEVRPEPYEILHPLVETRVSANAGEISYETTLSIDKHWLLADHRIVGKAVLPGTSYLEMVRFAASEVLGKESLVFSDVFFLAPLVVENEERAVVRLTLVPESSGYSFAVESITDSNERVLHVKGRVAACDVEPTDVSINFEDFKSRADDVMDPYIFESDTGVFKFGPHWDTVRAVWQTDKEALAFLKLDESIQHELDAFPLHPSMLDNAVNLTSQNTGDTFLPFMYKKLRYFAPLTRNVYTYLRMHTDKGSSGETMTYDIDLLDADGRVLVQITDYTVKRVHNFTSLESDKVPGRCMQMTWVLREETPEIPLTASSAPWALLATAGARAEQLADALVASGREVATYYLQAAGDGGTAATFNPDEDQLDALLDEAEKRGVEGIVFATDYTLEDDVRDHMLHSHEVFQSRRKVGVDGLFHLCRCLLKRKNKNIKHIKVLVRDTWEVDGSETGLSPLSAATAGLARVIGQEYRHIDVDVLDVSGTVSAHSVIEECFRGTGFRVLRPSGVYIEELQPRVVPSTRELSIETKGAYVITGGLGGLGLSIAERLADKGEATIVLLGRRQLAALDEWLELSTSDDMKTSQLYTRLLNLKARVGHIEYMSLDVADSAAIAALGDDLKTRYGGIAGIFHTAGVAGDGFLMLKDVSDFHDVLNPKLDGSVNLLRLLSEDGTNFLTLFSSITALTGGEGQGDYCAANAFLDALAEAGRRAGLNVTAVNWPSWREVGMAVDFAVDATESLFRPVDVEEGLNWLEHLIVEPEKRLVPADLNVSALARGETVPFRLALELTNRLRATEGEDRNRATREVEVMIKGTNSPTHTQRLLADAFGQLLGLSEIDIYVSFQDLGGNSLMTTQLLHIIEAHFPHTVDISDIFSYPSVNELAEYIDQQGQSVALDASSEKAAEDRGLVDLIEEELEGTEFLDEFMQQLRER